jgi:uncharacterized protein YdaU (DUF1376 family)
MASGEKPDIWMPIYIGDWDGDTAHLTCEEDGAYGRLVRHYWRVGPPPDDDRRLASIVRTDLKTWRRLRASLSPFFTIKDGLWRQKRVDAELIKWTEKRAKFIERASAGGRAKSAKSTASSTASSTPQAVLVGCSSSSSATLGPINGPSASGARFSNLEFRQEIAERLGEAWTASWLDQCLWRHLPAACIVAPHEFAAVKIRDGLRQMPADKRFAVVVEQAA